MHTPEQAKSLWCPMVRIGVTQNHGGPSAVNDPTTEYRGACIADRCAMWRWVPDHRAFIPSLYGSEAYELKEYKPSIVPDSWTFIPASATQTAGWQDPTPHSEPTHGYCGLAPVHGVAA